MVGFPCGSAGKESTCNAGDPSSIPGLGIPWRRERLLTPVFWPKEFHGLYSPGVAKSGTWLSNFHFLSFSQHYGMIVRNLYLSKSSFYKSSWGGSIFAKGLEWNCVYEWQKDLKPTVKKKKKITMQLTNKLGYCCNIQHSQIIIRIITDNILPGHIRILETQYNF